LKLQTTQVVNKDAVLEAKAKIEEQTAQLANDLSNQKRIQALVKRNYESQSQLDSINAAVKSDKAAVAAAKAAYQSSKDQTLLTASEIKQAEAAVSSARSSLEQARLNVSYTTIMAPVDGVITNRSVDKGMYVSAGMPLLSLVPIKSVWIVANFKETQVQYLRAGQAVSIKLDAYPEKKLQGEIDSLTPGSGSEFALLPTDNATGNFTKVVQRIPVKIRFTNKGGLEDKLYPGLSVEVNVDTRH